MGFHVPSFDLLESVLSVAVDLDRAREGAFERLDMTTIGATFSLRHRTQ